MSTHYFLFTFCSKRVYSSPKKDHSAVLSFLDTFSGRQMLKFTFIVYSHKFIICFLFSGCFLVFLIDVLFQMSGYWDNSYFDALNPSKEDSSEDGNQNQIDSNIPKWYEDPHEFQRSSETSLSYQYRSETPETPQRSQHRPADDSGYWTSSNSSYNSAISHASPRRSESVNSEPSTPMKLPSLESWRKVCPAKETTVSTSQSSATERKRPMSILERLIAEDSPSPPPNREKSDRLVQQANLKDSRSVSTGSKESDLREENTRTPQEGPFGEGWLNEVYWHHYQDFMNTNYYGIHGHQDQSTIPNVSDFQSDF